MIIRSAYMEPYQFFSRQRPWKTNSFRFFEAKIPFMSPSFSRRGIKRLTLNLRHGVGYFPPTSLMIETAKACKEDENHLTHGAKSI